MLVIPYRFFRGRVALAAILEALGVGPGDEVAVQGFTCVAVPEGIMARGSRPLWVDVAPGQVTMDPEDLRRKLTTKTKAILIQHTFGIPADMASLVSIANERGIPIIEDCAHTLYSTVANQRVGTFGAGAFYSFEWGKPLVAGVGGGATVESGLQTAMEKVVANYRQPAFLEEFRNVLSYQLYTHLYSPETFWRVRVLFRMAQALGIANKSYSPIKPGERKDYRRLMFRTSSRRLDLMLAHVESESLARRKLTDEYRAAFSGLPIKEPEIGPAAQPHLARFPVLTESKNRVAALAKEAGVEVATWYDTVIHPLKPSEQSVVLYQPGSCPNAERIAARLVSFPLNAHVTTHTIAKTAKALQGLVNG